MKAGSLDSSNPQITTAEDETLKRNTDCVYFLASPLTCKKGSECEYRHNEEARMNPRDCWYWMNGSCLNPMCSFRHPPLDGLLGTAVATLAKPFVSPSLAAAPMQLSAAHNPASNLGKQVNLHKQATPCYYFQKGLCLKGDRCPFMHEPLPVDNSVPQPPATRVPISVTDSQIPKKPMVGIQRCSTQQQRIQQGNIVKPVEVPTAAKPPAKPEIVLSRNGMAGTKTVPQTTSFNDEIPRYKPTNVPPVISADSVSRTHRSRQAYPLDYPRFQNGKEFDEFLAESSPGFDVLVDDELRGSDYYHNEEFGSMTGHDGRHVNTTNDFDFKRSSDYSSVGKFDQETYNDSRGYESYGLVQDQYVKEQRRSSSERISERPILLERRGYSRAESPNQVETSDLRYRLKHRKDNGSRSAVSPDRRREFYRRDDRDRNDGDQRFRDHSRRVSHSSVLHEGSIISNRLQGRIKLPGRSSPDNNYNEYHHERESDRGRLSPPGRLPTSSYHGRLQDRIKRRPNEDVTSEGRNFRGPPMKRDGVDNTSLNFAGPKRLAELKGSKVSNENHQRNTEIRKLLSYQESEGSQSFEGPKPLNVILKRKRKAGSSGDDTISLTTSRARGVAEKQCEGPFESKMEEAHGSKEEGVEEEEEGLISAEGDEVAHDSHSFALNESEPQDEGAIMTDSLEEQEFEMSDQRNGESDYEPVEGGGDFKAEEDDVNVEGEEDFSDDEDGDDFAKRIGVMFS